MPSAIGDTTYLVRQKEDLTLIGAVADYNDLTWPLSRLKSPATRRFVQQPAQAGNEENIKVPHHWPFVSGPHPT